ncbi:DPP IV N-terminal domain-containing protein [Sphingomonas sp. LY29]|uniref:S9 family peptidase n=1 Tax=Sphingomonas sp. LY29 TaxID=3095341 RepID=UPI002D7A044F|nr:DPP IV N-terminal domain-containing protein [Sphingomonas sp. LY29]WRP26037.1 DPP IV N-terminal domain-containing protein [Sphingomonas sp. LY29]
MIPTSAIAQTAPATVGTTPLTLERVFASPSLAGSPPRSLALSPDGKLVTLLRGRADELERLDLWAIDPATGQARMLVDSKKFATGATLSEAERMQRERARIANLRGIVRYEWSSDGKSILVPLEGDIYLASLNGEVRRLTKTKGSELDARVSEKGGFVSFVRDNELHVLNLATGKDVRITKGASETVSWGLAEFIAQEELGRTRGYWWSPDDKRIAVARVDESGVEVATRAAIGADKTTTFQQRYPRAGTDNAKVDLYLMNPDGSGMIKADLGTNADYYLARVNWLPDASALVVQRLSRDQKTLDYLKIDPRTGKSSLLMSDKAENWINLHDDFKPLKDGSFLFSSERSGFNHLYRMADGRVTQLTDGPWVTGGLVGVDEQSGKLFFSANRGNPIEYQLHSLDYRTASAQPQLLTRPGTNNGAVMDKTGKLALVSTSYPGQPQQVWLADGSGKRLAWIHENRVTGDHPYAPFAGLDAKPTYGKLLAADGRTQLDYRLIMPRLARGQRAPVLMTVYGGPQSQDVMNGYVSPLDQYLVQQGWALFRVNNRGQEGRGTAFQKPVYRALGGVEVQDQLAGLAWLKKQPGVQADKVAVYGHSYGGYMVLKLLEAAPNAFAAGVAGAPVTRWDLYDTHYTEKYAGDPRQLRAAYDKSDALRESGKIADPLMLIHGMSDDNVLFQHSTELMARMQEAKVPFETMVYPGLGHSISGTNISVHQWNTILNFLKRNEVAPTKR